jgi:ATP-binding cassette subfamily B multidrug efflux pump
LKFAKTKLPLLLVIVFLLQKMQTKLSFLEEGKILQQGSHNQLINQEGYYAELYLKQLSEKELS